MRWPGSGLQCFTEFSCPSIVCSVLVLVKYKQGENVDTLKRRDEEMRRPVWDVAV